jgi:hypothetical protein
MLGEPAQQGAAPGVQAGLPDMPQRQELRLPLPPPLPRRHRQGDAGGAAAEGGGDGLGERREGLRRGVLHRDAPQPLLALPRPAPAPAPAPACACGGGGGGGWAGGRVPVAAHDDQRAAAVGNVERVPHHKRAPVLLDGPGPVREDGAAAHVPEGVELGGGGGAGQLVEEPAARDAVEAHVRRAAGPAAAGGHPAHVAAPREGARVVGGGVVQAQGGRGAEGGGNALDLDDIG